MMQRRTFANDPKSVKQARRFVVEHLPAVDDHIADAVTLMVSELATNSIRHASLGFTVTVAVETNRLRIVVADGGPGAPVRRAPSPAETHGRGLQIVSKFSHDWGFTTTPEAGTAVWFTVQLGADHDTTVKAFSNTPGAPRGDLDVPPTHRATGQSGDPVAEPGVDRIDHHRERPDGRIDHQFGLGRHRHVDNASPARANSICRRGRTRARLDSLARL
jgi:anti-sigma regulatory factor (Ser/Thr protein kinase)